MYRGDYSNSMSIRSIFFSVLIVMLVVLDCFKNRVPEGSFFFSFRTVRSRRRGRERNLLFDLLRVTFARTSAEPWSDGRPRPSILLAGLLV